MSASGTTGADRMPTLRRPLSAARYPSLARIAALRACLTAGGE